MATSQNPASGWHNGFLSMESGAVAASRSGELQALERYPMDYIGIAYDTTAKRVWRIGAASKAALGYYCGDEASPILASMRRCVLKNSGDVYGYISKQNPKYYDGGGLADRDGTNGQVMIEMAGPAYVFTGVVGSVFIYAMSHLPLPGFTLHPRFVGVSAAYSGVYEGYVDANDKLCSIAGVYPSTTRTGSVTGGTRAAFRTWAENRGDNWLLEDYWTYHYWVMTAVCAWGSFNFQEAYGSDGNKLVGRTGIGTGDWVNDQRITITGRGDEYLYPDMSIDNDDAAGYDTDFVKYLYRENGHGHIWEWRDGINIIDNVPYAKTLPPFVDDISNYGYERLTDRDGDGITLPNANGWNLVPHSGLSIVFPETLGGDSLTDKGDYYYQAAGARVVRVSGPANHGSNAGPFYWYANGSSGDSSANSGGRLCYLKREPNA